MAVEEWALQIIASRRRETSHLGIKGELRMSSLAAAIFVKLFTILFVYRKFGLNIIAFPQHPYLPVKGCKNIINNFGFYLSHILGNL
jgi:hypothetical protein